jgi:hypothetical protein
MDLVHSYIIYATQGINWKDYIAEARMIRQTYELALWNTRFEYAMRQSESLHEVEVITGIILGTNTKSVRIFAKEMRQRFERDVAYVKDLISGIGTVAEDDEDGYDSGQGDGEGLARSIACFAFAMTETRESASFKYLAASICLTEIAVLHGGRLKIYGGAWIRS